MDNTLYRCRERLFQVVYNSLYSTLNPLRNPYDVPKSYQAECTGACGRLSMRIFSGELVRLLTQLDDDFRPGPIIQPQQLNLVEQRAIKITRGIYPWEPEVEKLKGWLDVLAALCLLDAVETIFQEKFYSEDLLTSMMYDNAYTLTKSTVPAREADVFVHRFTAWKTSLMSSSEQTVRQADYLGVKAAHREWNNAVKRLVKAAKEEREREKKRRLRPRAPEGAGVVAAVRRP